MQIRRGTLAAWAAASNPVLLPGELGFVTDVGKTAFKIGNTAGTGWDTLPYVNSTYPELPVDAGNDLNTSTAQGRYPLSSAVAYTNKPSEFTGSTTDGDSILIVTVPSSGIVIQELTTSLTSKRWIRAKNSATWYAWQRLHGVISSDSLTVVNLTATGTVVANQVGVGTASPATKIHVAVSNPTRGIVGTVQNTAGVTGSQIQITQSTIQDYVIGQPAATDAFAIWRGRNTSTDGTELVRLTSTALASTVNVTAPGVQAGAAGLTSSGGITVSNGTTSLTVPLVLGTAAGAGTSVFSTKNTSAAVVTTIRGDGVPTATTDLTTKTYVDTAVAGVTFREMMIVSCVGTVDSNFTGSNEITTGFTSANTTIILALTNAFTVTSVSNDPNSTITWTVPVISSRRRLAVSAGTWTVLAMSGGAALTDGAVFHCVRTA